VTSILNLGANGSLLAKVAALLGQVPEDVELRRFPDGEHYVRLPASTEADVLFATSLTGGSETLLPLLFAADAARAQGAARVALMAPYLPYMRQDKAFHEGEAVTSRTFAKLLSSSFDWMVTVDPHLHRYGKLGDIYSIPAVAVSAAEPLARWIAANVKDPLIIGPDSESAQWVKQIAGRAAAPHAVLSKTRRGDYDVKVEGDVDVRGRTPVLVDDVISSARTMADAVKLVRRSSSTSPVCVGVHALFAGDALEVLQDAGISLICTTDTIEHVTNRVSVAHELARAIQDWSAGSPQTQ